MMHPPVYYQGLWDFPDFHTYWEQWIRPNMLKDVETVFEGARERWEKDGMPKNGRGDFVLATALFSLFDHLGAFLAEDRGASLHADENIARIAHLLPSTQTVDLIVAHFGRHALVHGAWPQTGIVIDESSAFGLNVSADPRPINEHGEPTHNYLYRRRYRLPCLSSDSPVFDILKLRLNVRSLLDEFLAAPTVENTFSNVKSEVFTRVKEIAVNSSNLIPPKRNGTRRFNSKREDIKTQISAQLERAKSLGVW